MRGGSKCGPSMTWTCSLSWKNRPQDIGGVKSWNVMKNGGFFLENIIEKYPKITCNQQKSTSTSAWRRARAAPHSPTGQSAVKPNVSRTFHRYCSNWYPSLLTLSLFLKTQNLGLLFSTKVCVGICQSVIWFECEKEKCSSLSVPPLDTVELFVEGKSKNSPHFFW